MPVAPAQSSSFAWIRPRGLVALAFSLVLASFSVAAGCAGELEGNFPPPGGGSGGDSSGSGGSGSGSGGTTGSGGGTGSGGSTGSGGASMATCDAPTMIFKKTCGVAACHDAGATSPGLTGANPETNLIGKTSVFSSGGCDGETKLVNSTKPASGVFIKRITTGDCIDQMPQGAPALTADQVKCVTDWLNSKLP